MSIRNAFPGGRLNPFGASRPGRSVVLVLFRTIRLGEWIFRQRSCTKACHRGGFRWRLCGSTAWWSFAALGAGIQSPQSLLNPF